uniref:Uncharacterized protein n=1 Tax=viral metagenome TaxID=1070528 RepID=A0A6C0D435_9ZZZZ
MATISSFMFNNMDRIGNDVTDRSQTNVYNTRFANYTLSNYFSDNLSTSHVRFALEQPTMTFKDVVHGHGLNGQAVDVDSALLIKVGQERPIEKLQLMERPFRTVPYLGRGSCDPTLESQILQGENVSDKKSVSTIMEKSFAPYSLYPTDSKMEERANNASSVVQEAALDGWLRGGMTTRDMSMDPKMKQNNRPNGFF